MSADPWRTAKEWTLLEASYLCCGERPVTDDERRLKKTAHPAHIHAMSHRLSAEVPNEKVRTRYWRRYDWIFQREAVEAWAKQNGFSTPWEASTESRSDSLETHLRVLGLLALALAKKSGPGYQRGTEPIVSRLAELVEKTLAEELPDANKHGLGNTSIRVSIAAGLRQLTTDGKN